MMRFGRSLALLGMFVLGGCSSGGSGTSGPDAGGSDPVVLDRFEAGGPGGPETLVGSETEPGADSVSGEVLHTCEEPRSRVLFDLFKDPVESPFPSNYYRDPGSGALRLGEGPASNALLPMIETFADYTKAAAQADGFATYAPLVFLTSAPVDPASLPADEAATEQADASVRLLELDPQGGVGNPVPLRVSFREMQAQDGPRYLVTALPARLLEQDRTYLFVVTDAVRDASGGPLAASCGFLEVAGRSAIRTGDPDRVAVIGRERTRLAPLLAQLPDSGRVIAAVDFTTGHAPDETRDLFSLFRKGGTFQTLSWTLDADQDGSDDVAWGADYPECPMEPAALAYGVHGVFEPVNFTGPDNAFHRAAAAWQTFPAQRVEFWLMVPVGDGPHPVVVMAHGINSDHHQLCGVAQDFVRAGIATLRFDLPRHGNRGGGAGDFLDLTNPAKIRDNFRQAAADMLSATLLIEGLSGALDLQPRDAPDGVPDLDAARIGFLGHSLGAIVGALFLPFSDRIRAAVLNVGGVGLFHMVESYVVPDGVAGMYEIVGLIHIAPHLLWAADGVSFVHHLEGVPAYPGLGPKFVLAHEHMDDTTVPNITTDLMVRFAKIPLIEPFVKPIVGVSTIPAQQATSGLWQVDGVSHGAFTGSKANPKIELTRRQAVHYLKTFFDTGTPQVIVQ